jgi:PAS domain S-box-containing protein
VKTRILIVEDEPLMAQVIAKQVEELGYEAAAICAYGEEAVELAGKQHFDLALFDLRLAGEMDGITASILVHERYALPSIFITAAPDPEQIERAVEAQPYGYLTKPFNNAVLQLAVKMALYRLRTESNLRQRDEHLATVLCTSMDSYLILDLEGRILDVNDAACHMTGFDHTELQSMTIAELLHGHSPDQIAQKIKDILSKGSVLMECQIRTKGGALRTMEINVTASPLRHLVCFGRDVTERRCEEEALKLSERNLRATLDSLPDAASLKDPDGRYLAVNIAWLTRYGKQQSDVVGKTDFELFSHDHATEYRQRDEQVRRTLKPLCVVVEHITDSGDTTWLEVRKMPFRDSAGQYAGLVSMTRDITRQRNRENRLQLLNRAVEQSPVSIVITDPSGAIEYVNPWFEKHTGYSRQEAIGQNPRLLKSHEHPPAFYQDLWETIVAGREWRGEMRNRRKDASLYWEQASISAVHDDNGRIVNFVAVKEDITDRKATEQALIRAKDEAETANRAKSTFLATMSHELRTPLNVINGIAAILDGGQSPSEQARLGQLIANAGHGLLQIIEELLDYSGLQAGKARIDAAPFFPATIVGNALRLCSSTARSKGLNLSCCIDCEMPAEMIGDARRIQQILINLLHNAIKFTEAGRVHLRVSMRPAPIGEHILDFTIHDSGIGIVPENLQKLFQPFSQADASITRRFGGTGLGLAIAKSYVELMGGELRARSWPHQGSTFCFNVRLKASTHRATAAEEWTQPAFAGQRILIVGDGGAQQRMVAQLAEKWGMHPTSLSRRTLTSAQLPPEATYACAILDPDIASQADSPLAKWLAEPGHADHAPIIWVGRAEALLPSICTSRHVRLGSYVDPAELARALARLLATEETPQPEATPKKRVLGEALPLSILAADDNRTNREVVHLVFRHLGYIIETVENGADAVSMVQRKNYDLVMLDMQMPVMDGLTAAREICRLFPDRATRPKMVALTANALSGDRENCLQAGMDDYLSKPLLPHDLENCIRQLFGPKEPKEEKPVAPPKSAKPQQPLLLDRSHLETITSGLSSAQAISTLHQLHTSVCTDYNEVMPRIAELCTQHENNAFAETVHGLKGCFMMVGWTRLGRHCADALTLARKGEFTAWKTFPAELAQLFEKSSTEMTRYLAHRTGDSPLAASPAAPAPSATTPSAEPALSNPSASLNTEFSHA